MDKFKNHLQLKGLSSQIPGGLRKIWRIFKLFNYTKSVRNGSVKQYKNEIISQKTYCTKINNNDIFFLLFKISF